MTSFRATASPTQAGSRNVHSQPGMSPAQMLRQDDEGPLDRELLDLYVALLITVPLVWLLRSLWF